MIHLHKTSQFRCMSHWVILKKQFLKKIVFESFSNFFCCVRCVRIRSFLVCIFLHLDWIQYSARMRENTDQKNSEYGHFSRSAVLFCYCFLSRHLQKAFQTFVYLLNYYLDWVELVCISWRAITCSPNTKCVLWN